jgi:hypothetical protein
MTDPADNTKEDGVSELSDYEKGRLQGLADAIQISTACRERLGRMINKADRLGVLTNSLWGRGQTAFEIDSDLRKIHPDYGPPPEW